MRRHRPLLWAPVLLAVLAALVAAAPASAEAFGSPRDNYIADPIVDATAFWTGDHAVLLGGRNASGPQQTVQRFNPETGDSRVMETELPRDTQAAAEAWTGDRGYVFGGADIGKEDTVEIGGETQTVTRVVPDPHEQILQYNPGSGQVVETSEKLPNGTFGSAAAWVGDEAYIFGGANLSVEEQNPTQPDTYAYQYEDWILRWDPSSEDRLQRIGSFPKPIKDAEAVAYEGDIYLFGGVVEEEDEEGNSTLVPSDAVWRFDPETGDVTKLDVTLDTPLRWFSTILVRDRAYLFGGCQDSCEDPAQDESQRVYRYNFTTGTLDRFGAEQAALSWGPTIATMAVNTGGTDVWVMGGGRGLGQNTYDDVYANATSFEAGPTPPSSPTDPSANATEAGVELQWTEPLDDGGWGLDGYAVERSRPGAAFRRVAVVGADATSYTDGGAEPGVEQSYRIRALAPGGSSPPSSVVDAVAPTRPPAAPQQVDAVGLSESVLVRWTEPASDGGEPVEEYKVYRNGSLHETTENMSVRDAGVEPNVTYSYEVSAVNAEGEGAKAGPTEAVLGDLLPPPGNFTATSGASIELDWSAPPEMDPSHYEVLRGESPEDLSVATTVQNEGYNPDDVETGVPYWFAVVAVDGDQRSAQTLPRRAAILEPPTEPRNVTFEAEPGEVSLSWDAPRDAGGAEAVYYNVIRGDPDGSTTFISPDFWSETSRVDREVTAGISYNYSVEAVTSAGSGPRVGPLTVEVPEKNTPPTARLSASTLRPQVGQSVTFDASGSTDDEGHIVESLFTFGDGQGTGWIPRLDTAHSFSSPGKYKVKAQVKDDRGAVSNTTTVVVTVSGTTADNGTDEPGDDGNDTEEPGPGDNVTDTPPGSQGGESGGGIPGPGAGLATAAAVGAAALRRAAGRRRGG